MIYDIRLICAATQLQDPIPVLSSYAPKATAGASPIATSLAGKASQPPRQTCLFKIRPAPFF